MYSTALLGLDKDHRDKHIGGQQIPEHTRQEESLTPKLAETAHPSVHNAMSSMLPHPAPLRVDNKMYMNSPHHVSTLGVIAWMYRRIDLC